WVEAEAAHAAASLAVEIAILADGVEELAGRMDGEERRVARLGGELRGGEFAAGEVQFAAIDAFAGVGLRVCADEHPELAAGRVGGGGDRAERGRRESKNGDEEAFQLRSHVNSPS